MSSEDAPEISEALLTGSEDSGTADDSRETCELVSIDSLEADDEVPPLFDSVSAVSVQAAMLATMRALRITVTIFFIPFIFSTSFLIDVENRSVL